VIHADSSMLLQRWLDLCDRDQLRGGIVEVGQALIDRYSQSHRHYHNTSHLADCLRVFDAHVSQATDPVVTELALWFHDAIYEIGAKDNEQRSAGLAEETLCKIGLASQQVSAILAAILATAHHSPPATSDEGLVCDIDLSILSSPPDRYKAYAAAILAESGLSLHAFAPLRIRFLESMLAREHIFHTNEFRERSEVPARHNMSHEKARLGERGHVP
jgi:predicted metal-dependent HD superfamily phosphohydrolase